MHGLSRIVRATLIRTYTGSIEQDLAYNSASFLFSPLPSSLNFYLFLPIVCTVSEKRGIGEQVWEVEARGHVAAI